MVKLSKSRAAFELRDEICDLDDRISLIRKMANDICLTVESAPTPGQETKFGDNIASILGIMSCAVSEVSWKMSVLVELLDSFVAKIGALKALAEEPDEPDIPNAHNDLLDEIGVDEFNHVLRVITGKDIVSSQDISKLLNICMNMREGAEINV